MTGILVLGSKPEPSLPPSSAYTDLGCANASGFSAAKHGLPVPTYTVMSAILTSGIASGVQSLKVLAGLRTRDLYFFPRPAKGGAPLKRLVRRLRSGNTSPYYMKRVLARLPYGYERFIVHDHQWYRSLIEQLCAGDRQVLDILARKQPSTGMVAIALALSEPSYERVVLAGFSFELSHAYDRNPEIDERGTQVSRHADSDIALLRSVAAREPRLCTTEAVVSERTGIRLLAP